MEFVSKRKSQGIRFGETEKHGDGNENGESDSSSSDSGGELYEVEGSDMHNSQALSEVVVNIDATASAALGKSSSGVTHATAGTASTGIGKRKNWRTKFSTI